MDMRDAIAPELFQGERKFRSDFKRSEAVSKGGG